MLDAAPPLPGALVTALIDEIETTYSGYEIHLVERDGYRYRMVSHRDHVVYDAIRDESDHELLRRLTAEVERPHLCVGSVFVDAEKDALGVSIDALRDTSTRACELTTRSAKEKDGSRAARVTGVLRARLGSRARAFAIHRSSLVAWLARAAHFAPETRWDEILAMAVDDLARRPS